MATLRRRRSSGVTLELGGKSPNIVFADADLEAAAAAAPCSFLDNTGQDCCARTRILVQRSVYDRFLELLAPAVEAVTVGDPADEKTQMGPLISAAQLERVRSYVPEDAPAAIRGSAPDGPGFWFPPTVLDRRRPRRARRPSRRSSARSPSSSPSRTRPTRSGSPTPPTTACPAPSGPATSAARCASRAPSRAGNLSVNSHSSVRYWTPFGGFKQSGLGRELGPDALTAFTETKNVFISTEADAQ